MIATVDPLSPHESAAKHPTSLQSSVHKQKVWSMAKKKAAPVIPEQAHEAADDNNNGSDDSSEPGDADLDSDDSESEDEKHSDGLKLLSLESLDADGSVSNGTLHQEVIAADAKSTVADGAPVKRIVRRKRKRMSEDERRLRHREVQRQFMKRKRARLGEMRRFLRGLESQRRVAQIMNERVMLERQNMELRVLLANPGSGWQWGDGASTSPSRQQEPPPHPVYALPDTVFPMYHHQQPLLHQPVLQHSYDHRLIAPPQPSQPLEVPIPWDEILEAVFTDGLPGHGHDMSF